MPTNKAHHLLCSLLFLCFALFSSVSTLVLPLTHSLSPTRFASTHHLLKSTSARSAARFRNHHKQQQQQQKQGQVSLPLSPGSDYTLSFTLNATPPRTVSVFLDTGSDLVWFPCSPFECVLCEDKQPMTSAPVNLTSTSAMKVHCKAPSCSAVHSNLPSSDLCAISGCHLSSIEISNCKSSPCPPFYYAYGDGSLVGRLYTDSITLGPPLVIPKFTFACSHSTLAEPVGVAGFGRGLLSLPAQLAASSPELGNRFSYCLVSHSFNSNRTALPSPLILGRAPEPPEETTTDSDEKTNSKFAYTSLLDNPKNPYFYSVGLDGVSVGGRNIPAPSLLQKVDEHGTGGVVVDSGTTFTMLPSGFYTKVVDGFNDRMAGYVRAKEVEENTGLGPCYYAKNGGVLDVPALILRFSGSASSVALPKRNYFYQFVDESDGKGRSQKVGCMMLMNGGDEKELRGGPGATLGNYQQQGFEVVYDLEMNRVGFARRKCASLWERLNRGGV